MALPKLPIAKTIIAAAVLTHFAVDLSRYLRQGEVDTWNFNGWQPASAHLVNLWINLTLDGVASALIVLGTIYYAREAWRRRRAAR